MIYHSTSTSDTMHTVEREIIIKPTRSWFSLNLVEVWEYRQLLFYFVWRDVKVRYKQTVLGPLWAIINPVANLVLFTMLFGGLAKLDSEGVPYSIFTFAAILPWTFFSGALSNITTSLTGNTTLIQKVYFPRLILPLTNVFGRLPDFLLSFLVMIGLMIYYNIFPYPFRLLLLPVLILYAAIASLGVGLWFAALNVRYRDIGYISAYVVRFWMYATPVVYSINEIQQRNTGFLLSLYYANPMVSVIEGFRWVLLNKGGGIQSEMLVSVVVTFTVFLTGLMYFGRMEKYFADYV